MAQTLDLTADSGNRAAAGIKSIVQQNGGVEYHHLILDEVKLAEYFLAESITAANDDIMQLFDVKKGDILLGGYSYVETAGGTATSAPTWGSPGDADGLGGAFDPDATAATLVAGTLALPETLTADDTLDLVVVTEILVRAVASATGRWRLGVAILRAGGGLTQDFEVYVGDPNTPPQV